MYLDFFGFSETPFSLAPNPRFIYFSKPHKEVFALLTYGIERRYGFIEITGEVGTGKTTVLRTLISQLDEDKFRTALIFNPVMTAVDLLAAINREYGMKGDSENCSELLAELNNFLLEENSAGRTVVLIIDEAQNLSPELLEQIRLISNLETDTEKLIQIILAGQPELGTLLEKPSLRQLNQRIALRYHLKPLDREDTWGYIDHRLRLAGGGSKVSFSGWALRWLYHYSRGTPRVINILCDRALLVAYTWDRRKVTARTVAMAFSDVMLKPALGCLPKAGRSGKLAIAALLMVIAGYLYLSHAKKNETPHPRISRDLPESAVPVSESSEKSMDQAKSRVPEQTVKASPEEVAEKTGSLATQPKPAEKPVAIPAKEEMRQQQDRLKTNEQAPLPEKQSLSSAQAAILAFNGAAAKMRSYPIKRLNENKPVMDQLRMEASRRGLELDRFTGSLDDLFRLHQSSILEVTQKGLNESSYVGLTGFGRGNVSVQPPVSGKTSLSRKELASIWSGRAYILWRNSEKISLPLTSGEKGSDVIRLQILLQAAGSEALEVNGVYDEATMKAVKDFQRSRRIKATGTLGVSTLIQLYRSVTGPQHPDGAGSADGGGR
jgi:general secretion pathway protein A